MLQLTFLCQRLGKRGFYPLVLQFSKCQIETRSQMDVTNINKGRKELSSYLQKYFGGGKCSYGWGVIFLPATVLRTER